VIRRSGVVIALGVVAAGCGVLAAGPTHEPAAPARGAVSASPSQRAGRAYALSAPAKRFHVVVTIVDGDTGARVRRAFVSAGARGDRVNRSGNAGFRLFRRQSLVVRVAARGYARREVRLPFQRRRRFVVRVYRPELQWPMYGATSTRTEAHAGIHLRPPFRVIWSRGLGTLIEFPAVVSDGVAYIGNARETIRALSMRNGRVVWQHDVRGGKLAASPAVVGDDLVVHGMDGVVRVLDRVTGRERIVYRVGSPIESSPLVRDRVDYFGAWNGTVYALDLRTRRLRWTYRSGNKITSSAALAGHALYIGDYGGRVLAFAPGSGRLRWSAGVNGRIYGTPAVWGGRVFVPSSDGASLSAFTTGGRPLWRVRTGNYVYSSPAVWAGRVYFGSYNGLLYCVSAWSGRVLWTVQTGGPISGAPVVVDGVAYAGSFAHRIVGIDARSGKVLLRFPHGEYVPVSGNGGRLLLHGYSRIYAVEPLRARAVRSARLSAAPRPKPAAGIAQDRRARTWH
jgi:outer membrane protein assembly factor BamB